MFGAAVDWVEGEDGRERVLDYGEFDDEEEMIEHFFMKIGRCTGVKLGFVSS